jgi:protein phosphatase
MDGETVMIRALHAHGLKDVGQMRDNNEDEFRLQVTYGSDAAPRGLFVVADGMGGHAAGEVASRLAAEAITAQLAPLLTSQGDPKQTRRLDAEPSAGANPAALETAVRSAIAQANRTILDYAKVHSQAAREGMGTTVTLALVEGDTAVIANVGDSRTYLWHEGELNQVSTDHSMVASLVAAGQLEPEAVYTHANRNLIYRSLGGVTQVEVDVFHLHLVPGDRLLLCSDGLWEMVRDPEIGTILADAATPEAACTELVRQANAQGGEDNISVVVVHAL